MFLCRELVTIFPTLCWKKTAHLEPKNSKELEVVRKVEMTRSSVRKSQVVKNAYFGLDLLT